LTPPVTWASDEIPHVGRMADRLQLLREGPMIERFLEDFATPRERLGEEKWSPDRTQGLLHELWGGRPNGDPRTSDGRALEADDQVIRHPASHLGPDLDQCTTAFEVFRRICSFLDNESEACERGDFTKDRDERLAVGAGTKLKHRAWRWLVGAER
jgi:hypothetical protein